MKAKCFMLLSHITVQREATMKDTFFRYFCTIFVGILFLSIETSFAEDTKLGGHEVQTKLRLVSFDREFEDDEDDRDQTALAFEVQL